MYLMMYVQPVKTTVKEFTYEQSTYMQPVNKHLEFYVLFLYDFNSIQINQCLLPNFFNRDMDDD